MKQLPLLILLLTLFIVACSTSDPEPTATTETAVETTDNDTSTEVEQPAGLLDASVAGDVEIWHFWGSPVRRTAIRRVVAICDQQLPNISITETFKPWGDIWTANIAAVAAGSGMPGVIVEDRPQLPQRAADEIATNLQPFADADSFDTSVFWAFANEETLYDGDIYGVPFETDVRVLYWNKQLFEEVGLDPNDPPETWEELWDYSEQLDVVNEDGEYERMGFFPLFGVSPDFWAYTNGWEPVVDGQPNVNSPEYLETLEWINRWVEKYGGWQEIQNYQANFGAAPNDLFMSGGVGMYLNVAGYLSQLNFYRPSVQLANGENPRMEWGVSNIPYNTEPANWSGGFALSIPEGYENPEAAWEVIKCMSGPEGQASWSRDTFAIPTNREAASAPELMADPHWETIMNVMETSRGTTYVPAYPNYMEQVNTRLENVWTGDVSPAEMLEEAQQAIDATIADN